MNSIKRYLFIGVFLTFSSLAFAQNIKIIGVIPKTDTGKLYQLQIGAYRLTANVNKAAEILTKNGFVPQYEKKSDLTRVFVVANAAEVKTTVDRLARAGFKEVVIREYTGKSEIVKPAEVKPAETAEKTESEKPEEHEIILPIEEEISYEDKEDTVEFTFEFEFNFKTDDETWFEVPEFETDDPEHDLLHIYEE